jgi:hypothetical protein
MTRSYLVIKAPGHPRAYSNGCFIVSILKAEKALGKYLPEGAVVHHANLNRKDNRNCNLVICQDWAYHMLLHKRLRAFKACGHSDWLKCSRCKQYDLPENIMTYPGTGGHHFECNQKYWKIQNTKNVERRQAWARKAYALRKIRIAEGSFIPKRRRTKESVEIGGKL